MTSERDKREHLVSVIEDFDTAMLVTASAGGPIHGRPMGIAEVDGNGDLYFSTSIDSEKVRELEAEPRAAVVLQGKTKFASLSGTVRVVQDRATIDRLWKEGVEKGALPDALSKTAQSLIHDSLSCVLVRLYPSAPLTL